MKDTPDHIYKKQHEIFMSLPLEVRFRQGMAMIDDGRKLVEQSIKNSNPNISEIDLKIEVFKAFYKKDFSDSELVKIIAWFKEVDSIKK